jgi:predicted P-loop ATPase
VENTGKSKLVRAIGTPEWSCVLSRDLEGKEAHILIRSVWVAELDEMSSYSKTDEPRLKSFFTMQEDSYRPLYSNYRVVHPRRTVFIGTMNPEGENTYLKGQTGNTRYLPIAVHDIDVEGFEAIRTQLFAEALHYYQAHPDDWWQLSPEGETLVQEAREERRQPSVYEGSLRAWLEREQLKVVWWEMLADRFLRLPVERWIDTRARMAMGVALKELGWKKGKRERYDKAGLIIPWRPGPEWQASLGAPSVTTVTPPAVEERVPRLTQRQAQQWRHELRRGGPGL